MTAERHLVIYARLIGWFPRTYRERYRQEMLQLLRDQLRDAERLGDRHILREVLLRAYLELPFSLVNEYLSLGSDARRSLTHSSWLSSTVGFYLLIVASEVSVLLAYPLPFTFVLILAAALTLIGATFQDTKRILLAVMVAGGEVFSYVLMSGVVDSLRAASAERRGAIMADPFWDSVLQFTLTLVIPLCLAYALVLLYHHFPARFHRAPYAGLGEQETEKLRLRLRRRRRRNVWITAGIATLFLGLNGYGLYDPAQPHADLDLPTVLIAPDKNMAADLAAIPGGCEGPGKNTVDCQRSLELMHQAATKPYFQEESLRDPGRYTTINELASANITPLANLNQTVSYVLQAPTVDRVIEALKIGDAIQSSQGFLIDSLVGQSILDKALNAAVALESSGFLSASDREKLVSVLAALRDTRTGLKSGIKAEYLASRLALQSMRWQSGSILFFTSGVLPESPWNKPLRFTTEVVRSLPYRLPWSFQPNRTIAAVNDQVRGYLSAVDAGCSAVPTPSSQGEAYSLASFWKYNATGTQLVGLGYDYSNVIRRRCDLDGKVAALKERLSATMEL